MPLNLLADEEREVVRRAMEATFLYLDFDFETRLGVTVETMHSLLKDWPAVDEEADDGVGCVAINNALNDLLYGVGISDDEAKQSVGVDRAELQRIYSKWAAARGWKSTGVR